MQPEYRLLLSVLSLAVEDLTSSDERIRWEAHEFFLQQKGSWADHRRFLLDALGIDEQAMLAAIEDRLAPLPPEKPEQPFITGSKVDQAIPYTPFTARQIADRIGCRSTATVATHLHRLKAKGIVRRLDRVTWIRADSDHDLTPLPDRILGTLRDGQKTIRQIMWALNGEVDTSTIRTNLDRLIRERKVERDVVEYRLTPCFAEKDLLSLVVEVAG